MTKLSFALVGCGVVARKHLKAALFHKSRLNLKAVVDSRGDAAESLLRQCGLWPADRYGIRIYSDVTDMLAQTHPELTAITTPSGSHFAIAAAALNAGSHVMVEKPLTLNLAEADQLLRLADKHNLKIAVGHIYRFFPMVQALEKSLRAGHFGRVLYGDVKVRWGHDQAYYDQAAWRGTWQADGGALMNQSIHALDLMTWLLGGKIEQVTGLIDRQTHRMQAEDFGLALLTLDQGMYCQLEGTTNTDPNRQEASFYICCTEGEIRGGIMAGKPSITVRDRQGSKKTGAYLRRYLRELYRQDGLAAIMQLKNPHTALYSDLIRAIRDDRPPVADGLSGRVAVENVLAVYQSALTRQPVRLPVSDFNLQDMEGFFDQTGQKKTSNGGSHG